VTEEHIGPRVDEERNTLVFRGGPNGGDALRLPFDAVEPFSLDDPVFEIDPDDAELKKPGDVRREFTVISL
jgi:hypothetical protein